MWNTRKEPYAYRMHYFESSLQDSSPTLRPDVPACSHRLRFGWVILWFHPYWEDSSEDALTDLDQEWGLPLEASARSADAKVKRFVDSQ